VSWMHCETAQLCTHCELFLYALWLNTLRALPECIVTKYVVEWK
jgi:hypothetical protein